jgi:hypothetical protein
LAYSLILVGIPVVLAMLLVAYRAARGDTVALVALLLLGGAWLRIDKRFEGPLLIEVTRNHGLVTGDAVALVILGTAALFWLRSTLRRRALRQPDEPRPRESAGSQV